MNVSSDLYITDSGGQVLDCSIDHVTVIIKLIHFTCCSFVHQLLAIYAISIQFCRSKFIHVLSLSFHSHLRTHSSQLHIFPMHMYQKRTSNLKINMEKFTENATLFRNERLIFVAATANSIKGAPLLNLKPSTKLFRTN